METTRDFANAVVDSRLSELLAEIDQPSASLAQLLCDRHPPGSTAYRIVRADLSVHAISYGELRSRSETLAGAFHVAGLQPGDRIATLMGKGEDLVITLLAIWRLGAVHVPLFTAFALKEVAFRLERSNARAIVCDPAHREKISYAPDAGRQPLVVISTSDTGVAADLQLGHLITSGSTHPAWACQPDTPFIEIYTSGTTGRPKGVVVPARALAAFRAYAEFGLYLQPDDIFWNAADPGWGYGLYFGIIAALSTGVPSVMHQGGFDPDATWSILMRERVTNFAAAPTVFRSLMAHRWSSGRELALTKVSSAGEPLTPDVQAWAPDALGAPVFDHYGQTEAGMLVNNHHHPGLARPIRDRSMGVPSPGWTMSVLAPNEARPARIGEMGRLVIDVPASPLFWFNGYLNDPEKTAEKYVEDGRFYLTGDNARIDGDGYVYFAARDDDVVIMAGYRIGPTEIEATLNRHEAVLESAVIAAPDAIRGEVLEAVVVVKPDHIGDESLTHTLQQWVKREYAAHAYPRAIHYVDVLPKTPSGKIQRYLLRQMRQSAI